MLELNQIYNMDCMEDEDCFNAAKQRIDNHKAQTRMTLD
jgi:hypothetical protein